MKSEKDKLYIKTLLWAYEKHQEGFTLDQLKKSIGLTDTEWAWWREMFITTNGNDRKLIDLYHREENGNLSRYTLNDKGMAVVIDYTELQEARSSSRKALVFAGVSTLIGVAALSISIYTAFLTKDALELSAEPALGITLDQRNISGDTVMIAAGFLPTDHSILKLLLRNNSISAVENVDIRMTLWKYFVNKDSRHLTVCPIGYIDHTNNPNFQISNLQTDNLLNETFPLKSAEEYPFGIDLNNLRDFEIQPEGSRMLLKIDVDYIKSVSQTSYSYTKLFVLDIPNNQVIDIDVAPDHALALNDKKNEVKVDEFKFPSSVYPFREEEFLNHFKESAGGLDLLPSGCREFSLLKEEKFIVY